MSPLKTFSGRVPYSERTPYYQRQWSICITSNYAQLTNAKSEQARILDKRFLRTHFDTVERQDFKEYRFSLCGYSQMHLIA